MGDFSRRTFDAKKRYNGVLMQQGRVQLDADWNEQLEIQHHRTETETRDVIGRCGVPKERGGFLLGTTPDGRDLTIEPGRLYAGGVLCELAPSPFPLVPDPAIPEDATVPSLEVDGHALQAGQWLEVTGGGAVPQILEISSVDTSAKRLTFAVSLAAFTSPPSPPVTARRVVTYATQIDYPNPDHTVTPTSPPASPPNAGPLLQDGAYLAYVDAWKREVNALDDSRIKEVALGDPDTATRLKTVWQVKLLGIPEAQIPPEPKDACTARFAEWDALVSRARGTLEAETQTPEDPKNNCLLPPKAGYLRLENQLYRVEIHKVEGGKTHFKFSRDNDVVETAIEDIDGTKVVADTGKDAYLGFSSQQWVEVTDEDSRLSGRRYPLVKIDRVKPDKREIILETAIDEYKGRRGLKLRRWDQSGGGAGSDGIEATGIFQDLEAGVQVRLSAGPHRPGDYWLIPARTATGDVEWPTADGTPLARRPDGVDHHYCRIGLVGVQNGVIQLVDCRARFPALTNITADCVKYDNSNCLPQMADAETVQDALDVFCRDRKSTCTFVAEPGPGWESVFDAIGPRQDATVCLPVGHYPLAAEKMISGKGHIRLSGCGLGSRIDALSSEAALVFQSCSSVTVRDVRVAAGAVGSKRGTPTENLNGALTILECGWVKVRDVSVKCGSAAHRGATCLTVRNLKKAGSVRVQGCHFAVGHRQTGLLLVNVQRATVEDNVVTNYPKPKRLRLETRLEDRQLRAMIRRSMMSSTTIGAARATGEANATVTVGRNTIRFRTPNALRASWQPLVDANPARGSSARELKAHVEKLAGRILTDAPFRRRLPAFRDWFDTLQGQDPATASQGITVGGARAEDIRILNNSIRGVQQGIHVGLSHHDPTRSAHDLAQDVIIAGNRVNVRLPVEAAKKDRHGIFVGNCQSLVVENNNVRLERLAGAEHYDIDGIRVWGILGDRLMITHNYLASVDGNREKSFTFGIRVKPLVDKAPATALWVVTWNCAPSKQATISAPFTQRPSGTNRP